MPRADLSFGRKFLDCNFSNDDLLFHGCDGATKFFEVE
jgi:hypothetical protein